MKWKYSDCLKHCDILTQPQQYALHMGQHKQIYLKLAMITVCVCVCEIYCSIRCPSVKKILKMF